MRHTHLVLYHEKPMQKRLGLKIQRGVDVVSRTVQRGHMTVKHPTKSGKWLMPVDVLVGCGAEETSPGLIGYQPLPVFVVATIVIACPITGHPPVIAPWIPSEQLIATPTRQHDPDKSTRQPSDVIVWIALPDAQVFQVPDECR